MRDNGSRLQKGIILNSSASDRTIDPATGQTTITTRYKWVDTYDAQGKRKAIKDYNKVTTKPLDDVITFNMK